MSKLQIKSIFGNVIYECEALSAKECLEFAVKDNANLRGANLRGADLSGANLSGANISGANLRGANLRGADLSGANLSGANISGANLRGANLSGANLRGANLSGANISGVYLRGDFKINKTPIQVSTPVYFVTIFDIHMQIGCEFHSLEKWWKFDKSEVFEMNGKKALIFWKTWKPILKSICKANDRR